MNQHYDEPMDRISLSIPKKLHNGIKELAVKYLQKKAHFMRDMMQIGYYHFLEEEKKIDADRQDRPVGG